MEKIVVDAELGAKLDGKNRQVVLADASGRMLGYFMPPNILFHLLTGRFDREPTREEIDAAREDYRKNGGYTTAEVLGHLAEMDRWFTEQSR
ncbi:MAG: hypothetical protein K2X82_27120 [Gemmataceae bacterium]|nr:hypothetical protein [Gemmataceae bacterium]